MTEYHVEDHEFQSLRGKVVLITGAATGIGHSIAELAQRNGAKVAVLEVNEASGQELKKEFKENFLFRKGDVSKWADVAAFFEEAYSTLGPIDAVINNAGINKPELFTSTSELEAPDLSVINVNLVGTLNITQCALHFFKKHPKTPSQLVLFGSVASYIDTPPLYAYCASKGGVLMLMRALRTQVPKDNITVNMIAPWFTITAMLTEELRRVWGDLPANKTMDVARAALLPVVQPSINGKSFLVNGGNITEVEDKLDETQPLWMGSELDQNMREGQRRLIP